MREVLPIDGCFRSIQSSWFCCQRVGLIREFSAGAGADLAAGPCSMRSFRGTEVGGNVNGAHEKRKAKTPTSVRIVRWRVAGAVAIAAISAVSAVLVTQSPTATGTLSVSPAAPPPTTSTAAERRVHYKLPFGESSIEGDVVWPNGSQPRLNGEFQLRGKLTQLPCSVAVTFQAKNSAGANLSSQAERGCDRRDWPRYGPVYFESSRDLTRIDIVVLINRQPVARTTCPRDRDCQ